MVLDWSTFVTLRLNEHALHTWDIEVTFDPTATVPESAAAVLVDTIGLLAGFARKPNPAIAPIRVTTVDPRREFRLALGPVSVSLTPGAAGLPDLTLPAESLVRLITGRLDAAHTPTVAGNAYLDALRTSFPGM